ncbi:hypothetical protein C0J52_18735 [Blattella germanica]|nr:hypothetical protein C0J52_18735 [Blattella germanica]
MFKLIIVAVLLCSLKTVTSLICLENICKTVNCTHPSVLSIEHQPPCKENQRFNSYGTYCGCCPACVDILDVGGRCSYSLDLDSPPPLAECKQGLDCLKDRCTSPKTTSTTTPTTKMTTTVAPTTKV